MIWGPENFVRGKNPPYYISCQQNNKQWEIFDFLNWNMEMNGPGTSLFQGTDFINLNNLGTREEEEEAAEDQKKRDLEVVF